MGEKGKKGGKLESNDALGAKTAEPWKETDKLNQAKGRACNEESQQEKASSRKNVPINNGRPPFRGQGRPSIRMAKMPEGRDRGEELGPGVAEREEEGKR